MCMSACVCPCAPGLPGATFASVDKALDERTIGHNPERLCLMKVTHLAHIPSPHLKAALHLCNLGTSIAVTAHCEQGFVLPVRLVSKHS